MRKFTIGFSHSTKKFAPFSKAIIAWDDVPYSHVYFKFHSNKYEVNLIYQASSAMLNYMGEDVFLGINAVVKEFEIEVTEEQYDVIMKKCIVSAGLEYGLMQVFGLMLDDMFHIGRNVFGNDKQYHCSEWVAEILSTIGYKFSKPFDLVKPKDIYKLLSE